LQGELFHFRKCRQATLDRDLKAARGQVLTISGRRDRQAEETASAKALR
jgi:hypothetical protein